MSAEECFISAIKKYYPNERDDFFIAGDEEDNLVKKTVLEAMEQYSQHKADEQSVEFAMWVDKHYLAFNHGFVPVIGNRDTPISMEDLLARFKQEKQ